VEVADTPENQGWFREFKQRWKTRPEQRDLWVISYLIALE
jgi:hypothetical protein